MFVLQTSDSEPDVVGAATVEITIVANWLKQVQLAMIAINGGSTRVEQPSVKVCYYRH